MQNERVQGGNSTTWKMTLKQIGPWVAGAVTIAALAIGADRIALPGGVSAASAYTLTPVEYGMQLKTPDGRVVFEYLTKKPENIGLTSPSAACFHPVNTPSGERVTNIAPNDHPHHRESSSGGTTARFTHHQPAQITHPLRRCVRRRSPGRTSGAGECTLPAMAV